MFNEIEGQDHRSQRCLYGRKYVHSEEQDHSTGGNPPLKRQNRNRKAQDQSTGGNEQISREGPIELVSWDC